MSILATHINVLRVNLLRLALRPSLWEGEFKPRDCEFGAKNTIRRRMVVLYLCSMMLQSSMLQSSVAAEAIDSDLPAAPQLIVPNVQQRFADLFDKRAFRYTGGVYQDYPFQYWLYTPVMDTGKQYPIVVWLHGFGEAGRDDAKHLAWLGNLMMLPPWNRERFPYFVLCVRCPIENPIWNGAPDGTSFNELAGSDMISVTDAVLTELLGVSPIDQNRIYLAGVSSGGSGVWQYALRHPQRFAAVAPLAGGAVAGDYSRLTGVPVWAFHSTHDLGTSVTGARQNVAQLHAAGGHGKLTEIDTVSHDCWTAAFGQYGLLDWMLAQRRGGPIVMDHRPWWQRIKDLLDGWSVPKLIGQAVVIGLLIAGFFNVLKRLQTERWNRWSGRQSSG